jgi:hypothetical protein
MITTTRGMIHLPHDHPLLIIVVVVVFVGSLAYLEYSRNQD